jgi:hypothetical protein
MAPTMLKLLLDFFNKMQTTGNITGATANNTNNKCYFRQGQNIFSFSRMSKLYSWKTQIPIQWIPGAFFPGIKWPEREADN